MAWLKSFLTSLLTTVALSVIIFITTVSMVTGHFPPKWDKLKMTFTNLQKAMQLSQKVLGQTNFDELSKQYDAQKAAQLNQQQQQQAAPQVVPAALSSEAESRIAGLENENLRLKARIEKLEFQLKVIDARTAPSFK